MKFSLLEGAKVISKCGNIKIWHWAHKDKLECDPWWERESEWHRNWKNQFPEEWQEIIHYADSGEKDIADVKTVHGWVIEFQHSRISPEERLSRINFYKKLVWVIDGKKYKSDESNFNHYEVDKGLYRHRYEHKSLISKWYNPKLWSFFDFGGENLTLILPRFTKYYDYTATYSKQEFLDLFRRSEFNPGLDNLINERLRIANDYENQFEKEWRERTDLMHEQIKVSKGYNKN